MSKVRGESSKVAIKQSQTKAPFIPTTSGQVDFKRETRPDGD